MSRHQLRLRIGTGAVAVVAVAGAVVAVTAQRQPERSIEAFCSEIHDARDLDQVLASMDAGRLEPAVAALERATGVAPDEIGPDLDTVLALTTTLQHTIETSPTDKATALEQALRDHAGELAAVEAAGQRVQVYTDANCGIDLNTTDGPS